MLAELLVALELVAFGCCIIDGADLFLSVETLVIELVLPLDFLVLLALFMCSASNFFLISVGFPAFSRTHSGVVSR